MNHPWELTPRLDPRRFTFETVGDAYQAIKDGSARGKLVVDISPQAALGTS
jgi:NADPH2:quinone reductase